MKREETRDRMINQKELNIELEERAGLGKSYTPVEKQRELYSIVPF